MTQTEELIKKIAQRQTGNGFPNYIQYIRFPFYRNLERNIKLDLSFPLTVFVGANGCGKSSTLQALYGSPAGKSLGDHWFSTEVDPIKEGPDRHCLIYGYRDGAGIIRECLKRRIKDPKNPENWETSDPLQKYGMDPKAPRHPPIEKPVVYLDFRSSRSAFERAFALGEPPTRWAKVQDFLRDRTSYLRKAFDDKRIFERPPNDPVAELSPAEVQEISTILGRSYRGAQIIRHRFFSQWGYSVRFRSPVDTYSEAFAGSGEVAVVILVRELLNAQQGSLILLDEPENSLHPGAQAHLQLFLLKQALTKGHQIVVCTHSQTLIKGLPRSAIKVFYPTATGTFNVHSDIPPAEAFYYIGSSPTKTQIIVEDRLAKALVESVIQDMGPATAELFEIQNFPGGVKTAMQEATVYSRNPQSPTFLLADGDQKLTDQEYDPTSITDQERSDPDSLSIKLSHIIKDRAGFKIDFSVDGGAGGANITQKVQLQIAYIRYWNRNVCFLPFDCPEAAIWNQEVAHSLLATFLNPNDATAFIDSLTSVDPKTKFARLADTLVQRSDGSALSVFHKMFIKAWKSRAVNEVAAVQDVILKIKSLAHP